MADPTESGNSSDQEKDDSTSTPYEYGAEDVETQVTEGTSLLAPPVPTSQRRATYGGVAGFVKQEEEAWKKEDGGGWSGGGGGGIGGGQSVPNVIYASPARPHLPSPSASNPRLPGMFLQMWRWLMIVTPGMYLPYNWRTPAMVPYDVQAHPFNRAPSASPQIADAMRARYATPTSDTDVTGGSSRSSVWSVELEQGSCGCLSGYASSDFEW